MQFQPDRVMRAQVMVIVAGLLLSAPQAMAASVTIPAATVAPNKTAPAPAAKPAAKSKSVHKHVAKARASHRHMAARDWALHRPSTPRERAATRFLNRRALLASEHRDHITLRPPSQESIRYQDQLDEYRRLQDNYDRRLQDYRRSNPGYAPAQQLAPPPPPPAPMSAPTSERHAYAAPTPLHEERHAAIAPRDYQPAPQGYVPPQTYYAPPQPAYPPPQPAYPPPQTYYAPPPAYYGPPPGYYVPPPSYYAPPAMADVYPAGAVRMDPWGSYNPGPNNGY